MQHIKVVPYDATWPKKFQQEAQKVSDIVQTNQIAIIHIGSTSVPNLSAKPIIDILLIVNDIALLDRQQTQFEQLGYEYLGEFGLPGRRYLRKGGDNRTHQIHAYQYDNISEIQRHICFRNYLRKHRDVALQYGELKIKLASKYPESIDDYGDGKESFVKKYEALALKEYWQNQ